MKRKAAELSNEERIKTLDVLYTAAASLKGRSGMKLFLRDLLTESERIMLGRRILIAQALLTGDTYESIMKRMRVGPGTIDRVRRWLTDQFPGFENAIAEMERSMQMRKATPYSLAWMKKRYPLHFLLFPLSLKIRRLQSRK